MIDRVLLDLDGTIVNFVKGAAAAHNKPFPYKKGEMGNWNLTELFNLPPHQMWEPLGYEFWRNLEPYPYMDKLVMALESKFGVDNICLLTSPILTSGAIEGKLDWIREHLPQYKRRFLIGPAKEFCASPTNLLIDDYEGNEAKFKSAGGHTFLIPAPWNRRYAEDPLNSLTEWLSSID